MFIIIHSLPYCCCFVETWSCEGIYLKQNLCVVCKRYRYGFGQVNLIKSDDVSFAYAPSPPSRTSYWLHRCVINITKVLHTDESLGLGGIVQLAYLVPNVYVFSLADDPLDIKPDVDMMDFKEESYASSTISSSISAGTATHFFYHVL